MREDKTGSGKTVKAVNTILAERRCTMVVFWSVLIIVLLLIEGATISLQAIWFALGAIGALLAALFGAPEWLQFAWFVVISCVALYFTRPLVKKYINSRREATNADRVIGGVCVVTETIDNIAGTGAVKIGGKLWTARSAGGEVFAEGELVTAAAIEGVKLMVTEHKEAVTASEREG